MVDDPGAQETAAAEGAAEGGVQEVAAADGRPQAWNGRLIMAYGGGVQANFHSGRSCGLDDERAYVADGEGQGYQDIFIERGYATARSEEHTSELQSLMRISYAVFCLKKKKTSKQTLN